MKIVSFLMLHLFCFSQTVTTIATSPLINDGMFVGKSNNIYTTVGGLIGGTQVGKISPTGEVSVLSDGFSGTIDVYTADEELFYVTNYDDNTLKTYHTKTNKVSTITKGLDGPASIAVDKKGFLYITNFGAPPAFAGNSITKVDPKSGEKSVFFQSKVLFRPQAIIYNPDGFFYLVNTPRGRIFKLTENKVLSDFTFINAPIGNIAKKGNTIFGTSNRGHQLYVIDTDGNYMTFSGNGEAGTVDGTIENARFQTPLGLTLSNDKKILYVAQASNGSLRKITINDYQFNIEQELKKRAIKFQLNSREIKIDSKDQLQNKQLINLDGTELLLIENTDANTETISISTFKRPYLLTFKLGDKRFGLMVK